MQAMQLVTTPEPATGQSFGGWLTDELSASGTGGRSFFKLTYLTSELSEQNALPSLIQPPVLTDPGAGFRVKQAELLNWTKNLQSLTAAAKIIIPGIRALTEPEQRNLRGIYKKLSRKA